MSSNRIIVESPLPGLESITIRSEQPTSQIAATPGLIWGFDLGGGAACATEHCDGDGGGFRWVHLSLAHQGTANWISRRGDLPDDVKEMLLAGDSHQRALVDDGVVGCVLHDFERDFETTDSSRIGALRFALTEGMMVTVRLHPIRSADIVRDRLTRGRGIAEASEALDLLVSVIAEGIMLSVRELSGDVQRAEDAFLDDRNPPTPRDLINIRRRLAQVTRILDGMAAVFRRLEKDVELPEVLRPTVEKLLQRVQSLDADAVGVQRQLRQLREEIDIQIDQRTNQNLYILSMMTALMLPATFVTGLFGMNTGGLPWADPSYGTLLAAMLAFGAAAATFLALRWMGFMRR